MPITHVQPMTAPTEIDTHF